MPENEGQLRRGAKLEVVRLSKSFGGIAAVDGVTVGFEEGSLTAIIGPNGAGKTTFFHLITGGLLPDKGEVWLDGHKLEGLTPMHGVHRGIVRAFQIAQIFPDLSVEETLQAAVAVRHRRHRSLFAHFPNDEDREEAAQCMVQFDLAEFAGVLARALPHGAKKRLDLALAVALQPKVLLLDEPTAGQGHEGRALIGGYIRRISREQGTTIILVEHDMDLVFDLAERILVLNFGRLLADGSPPEIRRNEQVIRAYLGDVVALEGV